MFGFCRLRSGSLSGVFVVALIALLLFLGCRLAAASPREVKQLAAHVVTDINVEKGVSFVKWCDPVESTFVVKTEYRVFLYSVTGKLIWKFDGSFEMGRINFLSCSRDGKLLYFNNKFGNRLAIYSAENGLSEYEMSAPDDYEPSLELMSPDGSAFFLPATPSLISGKDVLHDKHVLLVGNKNAYWTPDFVFVQTDNKRYVRVLRASDLSQVAIVKLKLGYLEVLSAIFKKRGIYVASIYRGMPEDYVEQQINDPRVRLNSTSSSAARASGPNQGNDIRVETHTRRGSSYLESVSIFRKNIEERVDLTAIKDPIDKEAVSPDGRFIVARRQVETSRVGGPSLQIATWDDHIVVL